MENAVFGFQKGRKNNGAAGFLVYLFEELDGF
jgi:hypothetical protein